MTLVGQIQHHRPLCQNGAGFSVPGPSRTAEGAGNIGIHAVAGDVLAQLIHDQNIRLVHPDAAQQPIGFLQQLRLLLPDFRCVQSGDLVGLVIGVFDDAHTGDDIGVVKDHPRKLGHDAAHVLEAGLVDGFRAMLLAHTDDGHFQKAALIGAAERSVGLDPAAEDHAVRFVGVLVLIDGASLNGVPR